MNGTTYKTSCCRRASLCPLKYTLTYFRFFEFFLVNFHYKRAEIPKSKSFKQVKRLSSNSVKELSRVKSKGSDIFPKKLKAEWRCWEFCCWSPSSFMLCIVSIFYLALKLICCCCCQLKLFLDFYMRWIQDIPKKQAIQIKYQFGGLGLWGSE